MAKSSSGQVEAGDDKGGLVGGGGVDDTAAHAASHHFAWDDGAHHSGLDDGTAMSAGAPNYLQAQYIYSGPGGRAVSADSDNVFIHGGDGDDAIAVHGGRNVLDGGHGSNFLTGGSGADGGSDTFFVDTRGHGVVWNTLQNFHTGDDVTVWGFNPGVSKVTWAENEGAVGARGATMHIETHGAGTGIDASVTFAGLSVTDAQSRLGTSTGTSAEGSSYLYMHNHG